MGHRLAVRVAPIGENHSVRQITTGSGDFVLKDITDCFTLIRLAFNCAVIEHLAAGGIPVVRPVKTRTGEYAACHEGRSYLLMPLVRARPAADRASRADIRRHTGQVIADVHTRLATYPAESLLEHTWREDLAGGVVRWAEYLANVLPDHLSRIVREAWTARCGEAVADTGSDHA